MEASHLHHEYREIPPLWLVIWTAWSYFSSLMFQMGEEARCTKTFKKSHILPKKQGIDVVCCKVYFKRMLFLFSVLLTFAEISHQSDSWWWQSPWILESGVYLPLSRLGLPGWWEFTKIPLPAQLINDNLLIKMKISKSSDPMRSFPGAVLTSFFMYIFASVDLRWRNASTL